MVCHYQMVMVFSKSMKDTLVPIDQAGRLVLPKHVRQELAIKGACDQTWRHIQSLH
jgi:DNA-binding transcriptional regulator/RsmH inhibitor MraZ